MESPTPEPVQRIPNNIVYAVPGMELVVATYTDVSFSTEKESLKLDVYTPPDLAADERLPTVLFVHGSAADARNSKNHGQYDPWGKLVGVSGLIAVTFNWDYPDPSGIK